MFTGNVFVDLGSECAGLGSDANYSARRLEIEPLWAGANCNRIIILIVP